MNVLKDSIETFIRKYSTVNDIKFLENLQISFEKLVDSVTKNESENISLTKFQAYEDTFIFGKLITSSLQELKKNSSSPRRVIDLGCGSCLPTLLAIKDGLLTSDTEIIAVDIDQPSIEIAKKNVSRTGFLHMYSFINSDMIDFINDFHFKHNDFIISNPPYLSVPLDLNDDDLGPVDGGERGIKYIKKILEKEWEKGTVIFLISSTLSDPQTVFDIIEKKFDVLNLTVTECPFFRYLGKQPIFEHTQKLRNDDIVYYFEKNGKNYYYEFGILLQKN